MVAGVKVKGLAGVKVERAKEMMLRDLSQPVPLADVASACGFSYHHFIASFRAAVGVTPYAWVTNQRVIAAQKLMLDHPKMRLVDIALSVGFGEQHGLGRVFKNLEGTTPDAWRRRQLAARAKLAGVPPTASRLLHAHRLSSAQSPAGASARQRQSSTDRGEHA